MPSSVRLCRIAPWEVPEMWEFVAGELNRALIHNGGESDLSDLWRDLVTNKQTLWTVWDSDAAEIICCLTTYIHDYERLRVFFIALLAGKNAARFVELEDELFRFARESGCHEVRSFAIPRVAKHMQRLSPEFEVTHHILARKL